MKTHSILTKRQVDILSFIYEYQRTTGFPPSIREIGKAVGIRSTSAVNYQINRLMTLEYLGKVSDVSRSITLLSSAYEAIKVPVPAESDFSILRAELLALRAHNKCIREQYESRVKHLENERNQLSQMLTMLKYKIIEQLEDVFEEGIEL